MMWFKRESKAVPEKVAENGVVGKLRRKKAVLLKPTRESSERETSTESEKEKRRYSDILDIKVSQERRDESDESLYESADCHSDAISASDDALPRLSKTPTMSKESLKLAVTDEEVDGVVLRNKKGHRKTMSLSNPLEIVKTLGDEWFDSTKKELEKHSDKIKSKESLWSEEDRDSINGSSIKLDQSSRNSKKEDSKSVSSSRKSSTAEAPKSRKSSKSSSVSALNFLRRKKTPTTSFKAVEAVAEAVGKIISTDELLNYTKIFLEEEKRNAAVKEIQAPVDTDSDEEHVVPKLSEHRRRLSRQTSRSKSKARGKSQSVKVNTLRKSHSGTLKKGKKKSVKTPLAGRSRQASVVEATPVMKKKSSEFNSWLFSGNRGEARREGSADDTAAADGDVDVDLAAKETPEKDNNWRLTASGRGVNRAESCRERDAPRRGKHRNASDPNRLTAINHNDLEPGAATAPSGSSSSSSLSSRSNESNTVATEQHASASEWSDEEEPLPAQWADSLPPRAIDSLNLSSRLRKRQEVIHELIVSEGSHVRWLKVLASVFLRPLECQPSLLPPDELRALFPNLPGVRERHGRLYSDLKAQRNDNLNVGLRPVAEAMLNTLGDSGYAPCLARFCRGQRLALDALKERRRKNKELREFLAAREQMPLCGRLQLRDLLACVWQRLTKYQLLLESILKTVLESPTEEEEADSPEDVAVVKRALAVAKDVLQHVDTAIRTAENEHRLRAIQSKLEIRIPMSGPEWEEPKRLDLTQHSLRMEGELHIRNDSNKKINVLGLMLEDCLVLLQREGEKFVLKPITQPSQQTLLSPLVRWERVLFRPNAAVRNAFFLMNINGVQMHELSANTHNEYTTWVKHMEDLPLAKPELKPSLTPAHHPSRSTDDSGINVSRNPSDASEKSTSSTNADESERDRTSVDRLSEKDRASLDRASDRDKNSAERSVDEKREREERSVEKEDVAEREEKHKPRRPTVGRISTHGTEPAPVLLDPRAAVTVQPPLADTIAHTAERVLTHQERLRRLDAGISLALRAKSAVVGELLGVAPDQFAQLADLAVADTLGEVDVSNEMLSARLSRNNSVEEGARQDDVHQLLLAAQAQANQLTAMLSRALSVSETATVLSRAPSHAGRCDSCRRHVRGDQRISDMSIHEQTEPLNPPAPSSVPSGVRLAEQAEEELARLVPAGVPLAAGDLGGDGGEFDGGSTAAVLATRLVSVAGGLQAALARLVTSLPHTHAQLQLARRERAVHREREDGGRGKSFPSAEEISFPKDGSDPSIQDQPSNGG